MDSDVAALAAQVTPYMSAAAAAYGGAVLAKVRDDAADATVGLGRRLLRRIFGTRKDTDPLPVPLEEVLANPDDEDAVAVLRLAVRKILAADDQLRADVANMLSSAGLTISAPGDRAIAAQHIGIAVTGDNATIGK